VMADLIGSIRGDDPRRMFERFGRSHGNDADGQR
jgi:hypothetical protein